MREGSCDFVDKLVKSFFHAVNLFEYSSVVFVNRECIAQLKIFVLPIYLPQEGLNLEGYNLAW